MPRPPDQWPTGRLVSAVARRIERDRNAHLAHWDLNHASLPVLHLLAGGLDRTGYVRRRPHAQGRRRHDVVLTPAGQAALAEAGDAPTAEQMSIRGLTPEQVTQLRQILAVMMRERPQETDPRPGPPEADRR